MSSNYKIILCLVTVTVCCLKLHHQNIIPGIIHSYDLWEPHQQILVYLQSQGVVVELLLLSLHFAGLQLVLDLLDSGASLSQFHQTLLHLFPSILQITTITEIKMC